jgi:hypothetical protein
VEGFTRGGDVVVEQKDGSFDQAEVEDVAEAVDPGGEERAGCDWLVGFSVLGGVRM